MTHFISIIMIGLYVYTLVSIISVLLLENRNPAKSLSWILVLIFLPFLGMLFYVLFGQDLRKRKIVSKKTSRALQAKSLKVKVGSAVNSSSLSHQKKLIHLLQRHPDGRLYFDNKIDLFANGERTFDAVFEAIQSAKKHIHLEFFIFADDKISNKLRELLIEKANQGVDVRMIYDYWGSFDLSKRYLRTLREAGVHVHSFLPFRFRFRFSSSDINYRNHRKLVIIDGIIGFTGGVNVADRYVYGNNLGNWRDTFVRFEGDIVHGLQNLFLDDWCFVGGKLTHHFDFFPDPNKFTTNAVQFISSGPDSDWEWIMLGITTAIQLAERYVYIHTPYFMPSDIVSNAIHMAALSGVDVILMIPDRSDASFSDSSSSTYLGVALEAGVKVYRYSDGFLHSKAIVIDDVISIIGSCNMDERSFVQNYEANAFIYDKSTAIALKLLFLDDITKCRQQTYEEWMNRKRRQKLKESFARLFSPLM